VRIHSNQTIIFATVFSTMVHIFVMAILDNIRLMPRRITPRANVYMVDLLPAPKIVTPAPAPVKKTEEKKVETKEIVKKKVVKKKPQVTVSKKAPIKVRKEKPKVNEEQKLQAAINKIKNRVEKRETQQAEEQAQTAITNSLLEIWKTLVDQQVRRFWVIPDTLSDLEHLEAVIIVEIDKDGVVMASRFERSSGNPYYDQSAMRAVTKAAPFPPPPVGEAPVKVGLVFQAQRT